MFAARFVSALVSLEGKDEPGGNLPYKSVRISLVDKMFVKGDSYMVSGEITPEMVGWFGRAHMRESLWNKEI